MERACSIQPGVVAALRKAASSTVLPCAACACAIFRARFGAQINLSQTQIIPVTTVTSTRIKAKLFAIITYPCPREVWPRRHLEGFLPCRSTSYVFYLLFASLVVSSYGSRHRHNT